MNRSIYEKASDEIHNLCDGTRKFTMNVPVRDNDTDIVISAALELAKLLAETVQNAHTGETHAERSRLWAEAKLAADAYLSNEYIAEEMKSALAFDPGDIVVSNTRIKRVSHGS